MHARNEQGYNLELALRMLGDARECIEKEDAVQASEKLYKK